jgi:DNA-directed RNA polymerase beta subunit
MSLIQDINSETSELWKTVKAKNDQLHNEIHSQLFAVGMENMIRSQFIIRNYDNYLDERLPKVVMQKYKFGDITVEFSNMIIEGPGTISGTDKPKNPRWCILHNETYELEIKATVSIYSNFEKMPDKITTLFHIPLMVGSKRCTLSNLVSDKLSNYDNRKMFSAYGMDPVDPLGYYIIKGTERLILIQEKLRKNMVLNIPIAPKDKKARKNNALNHDFSIKIEAKMTNDTIMGGKLFILKQDKGVLKTHFTDLGADKNKNQIFINALAFFGYEFLNQEKWDYARIVQEIKKFTNILGIGQIQTFLSKTFFELNKFPYRGLTELTNTDYKNFKDIGDLLVQRSDVIRKGETFFTNCMKKNKIYNYCYYIAKYIEVSLGFKNPDERDIWAVKRLNLGSESLAQLINGQFTGAVLTKLKDEKRIDMMYKKITEFKTGLDKIIGSSMSGPNWGPEGTYNNTSMTEAVDRKSITNVYSQLTKINVRVDSQTKNQSIRAVHGDQWGYICPAETPDGEMCGLNKHLSVLADISMERDRNELLKYLTFDDYSSGKSSVFINGDFFGWCDALTMRQNILNIRRTKAIFYDISVFVENFDVIDNTNRKLGAVFIYCDSGRPIRPLLIMENGRPKIDDKDIELLIKLKNAPKKEKLREEFTFKSFSEYLRNGSIEFIDCLESHQIFVAQSIHDLTEKARNIDLLKNDLTKELKEETRKGIEIRIQQLQKKLLVSHMELDPTSIYSYAASMVPLPNHIPAPRVAYQANMNKQGLSLINVAHRYNFDSYKMLVAARRPLFETDMSKILGLKNRGGGVTVLLAIMPFMGYNQEDAIIINKRTNDLGYFAFIKYVTKEDIIKKGTFTTVKAPENDERNQYKFRHLSDTGYVKVGSEIKAGDIMISKFKKENSDSTDKPIAVHISASIDDVGVVEKVESFNLNGDQVIRIKIRQYHYGVEVGDKLAIRYSQKGIVGLITDQFPTIMSGPYQGVQPDVMINPHAMPSRMTVSLLIEMITGKKAAMTGERFNASAFKKFDMDDLLQELSLYGMDISGKEIMMSPDGKIYNNRISVGPIYYISLPHFVKSKIQARNTGRYDLATKQPIAGRGVGGGLRVGEMEVWALVSHGALEVVKDRLIKNADPYNLVMCSKCNKVAEFNYAEGKFECPGSECNGSSLGKLSVPYSLIRFLDLLKVGSVNAKLIVGLETAADEREENNIQEDELSEEEEEVPEEIDDFE